VDEENLKVLIQRIVKKAARLKDMRTKEREARVNYACIFSQSEKQFLELKEAASKIGEVVKMTSSGPLFKIVPLETPAGRLKLLKIRLYDITRPELGDADFTVRDYLSFKKQCLSQQGFKLIQRENYEMIELMGDGFDVRVYFSNPPLDEQLDL